MERPKKFTAVSSFKTDRPMTGQAYPTTLDDPTVVVNDVILTTEISPATSASQSPQDRLNTTASARKKLWEVDHRYCCSLIGTCASLTDLRKIVRKCRLHDLYNLSDYHLHTSFVNAAGKPHAPIRALNKLLDKKYDSSIRRFSAVTSESIEKLWAEAVSGGDIAGAYWSIMTHRTTSSALLETALGTVHMMSHLNGASTQKELYKASQTLLENQCLRKKLIKVQKGCEVLRAENVTITAKLNLSKAKLCSLRKTIDQQQTNDASDEVKHREQEKQRLLETISQLRLSHNRQQGQILKIQSENACLSQNQSILEQKLKASEDERAAVEQLLEIHLRLHAPSISSPGPIEHTNLEQCSILYVGGRERQQAHFRSIVERLNGKFFYHDGGIQGGVQHLESLLHRCDIVYCPVDCCSHEAVARIQRHCTRHQKQCVLLRRASLSAFTHALQDLSTNTSNQKISSFI